MAGDAWESTSLGDFVTLQTFGITGWHDEAKARGPGVTVGRSGASFGVVDSVRKVLQKRLSAQAEGSR